MSGATVAQEHRRWEALKTFALRLNDDRAATAAKEDVVDLQPELDQLIEEGVLVEVDGSVRFLHETLFDHVFARAFIEDGRSLTATVTEGSQDLSRRGLVRQVLTYQRGVDRDGYSAAVTELLHAPSVRFHLRDVVFAVMRDDEEPRESDWAAIEPFVLDPKRDEYPSAWSVLIRPPWFRLVDRMGRIVKWMASDDRAHMDLATRLLRAVQAHEPRRVATLIAPYVVVGGDWSNRVRWIIPSGSPQDDRRYFELLLDSLDEGLFDEGSKFRDEPLWTAAHELPAKRPAWAVELLGAYVERGLELTPAGSNPFEVTFPDAEYWLDEYVSATARHEPRLFARAVLPTVIHTIDRTAGTPNEDGTRRGDPWSALRQVSGGHGFEWALFDALDGALQALARSKPRSVRPLIRSLLTIGNCESARYLIYRAWTENPEQFAEAALTFLTQEPSPFACGYADSPYWVTGQLIGSLQTLPPRKLYPLGEAVMGFTPYWERSAAGRQERGLAQWTLLQAFDYERLSQDARRRRDELARKFAGVKLRPTGIQVGVVGSPIPESNAEKMTDAEWLRALQRYDTDENRQWLKGGAVELSRVLEQQMKSQPQRFARLALKFGRETNENYAEAILRGLADATGEVGAELLFDVVRHFFDLPQRPGGRWIARPLAQVADKDVPEDILDIAAWYATEHPDPSGDTWKPDPETGVEFYGGDPFTAGINSVRGAGAEALSALIWPDARRLAYLLPALSQVVKDPTIAVRTCAAIAVRSASRHDEPLSIELFLRLVDTHDVLLSTRPVEDYMAIVSARHFEQLRPVLDRMLSSDLVDVREAGGRQATLAALGATNASDLVEKALDGDAPMRKGVAQVAAFNVRHPEIGPACLPWLRRLFHDDDPDVRNAASDWTRELGPRDLQKLAQLARDFISSPAYADDEGGMLRALDESTVPIADLAIEAVRMFLEHKGMDVGNFQRRAALDARVASKLAVRAYTSATNPEMREDALDLIDRLLAARVSEMAELVQAFDQAS
jgi:hypothetical protein